MQKLVRIDSEPGLFTLDSANEILPLVERITARSSQGVQERIQQIDQALFSDTIFASRIENEINEIIEDWQNKMIKLGVHPKGLWVVDFDFGQGYFCWKFPEQEVGFWHGYKEGFSSRKPVTLLNL